MSNFTAFNALTLSEIRLYFSSRRTLIMNVLAPILIAAFFGYVFSPQQQKAPHVPIAIVDQDGSALSNAIATALKSDPSLEARSVDEAEATRLVGNGKLTAAVVLPAKFGANATSALFVPNNRPTVTLIEDPSKALEVSLVQGLLMQHVMESVTRAAFSSNRLNRETIDNWRRNLTAPETTMSAESKASLNTLLDSLARVQAGAANIQNPDASAGRTGSGGLSQPFNLQKKAATAAHDAVYNGYAHSFAGMSVQFILFMGIDLGVALLLARRLGLWKRLRAAPLSRTVLIGSRLASGTVVATALMFVIFAAAITIFGVRIRGSAWGFALIALTFAMMTASFGLFIAAVGKTPEATRGLAIMVTLIMVMLGGAWVPSFIFPAWLQTASLAVPTRWAVDGLDAMTWRGLGFDAALMPSIVLFAFAVLFAVLALWRFQWDE